MTIPRDLPGTPPPEDDAVDLAVRLMDLIDQYPKDAQGRKRLREVVNTINRRTKGEGAVAEWNPVDTWPNDGPMWIPTTWIIPHMLPAARVSLFSGEGAAGKTRIVMQLAAALSLRFPKPFLEKASIKDPPHFAGAYGPDGQAMPDWQGGRVVWATWETAPGDFQKRLVAAAAKTPLNELSGRLHFINMRPHGGMWGPGPEKHISTAASILEGGQKLLDYAETVKAKILVIDPLAAAYASNENDRALVRAFITHLAEWADQTGCAVLIIAHPSKSRDDSYSGSTDWHNSVQGRWTLAPCKCQPMESPPCQVQRLLVEKLSEDMKRQEALTFAWDDVQHTLVLVSHDRPQVTSRNARTNKKNSPKTPSDDADQQTSRNARTNKSLPQPSSEDGDRQKPMTTSINGGADDSDWDLH